MDESETIESKIKDMSKYNGCRACKHFIRVNFESPMNVMHRQGFCILGQLEGDYHLYYSSGGGTTCMGYVFSQYHNDIDIAERQLNENEKEFCHSIRDKRSKNYKLIEPLIAETQEYIKKVKTEHMGLGYMLSMREVEVTAHKYFRDTHSEEYLKVYQMVTLRKADYNKFLAKIAVKIHGEFCTCNKIEYTEGDE